MLKFNNEKKAIYLAIVFIVFITTIFFLFKKPSNSNTTLEVSKKPIHWHPKLKIIIKGQEQFIPPTLV